MLIQISSGLFLTSSFFWLNKLNSCHIGNILFRHFILSTTGNSRIFTEMGIGHVSFFEHLRWHRGKMLWCPDCYKINGNSKSLMQYLKNNSPLRVDFNWNIITFANISFLMISSGWWRFLRINYFSKLHFGLKPWFKKFHHYAHNIIILQIYSKFLMTSIVWWHSYNILFFILTL